MHSANIACRSCANGTDQMRRSKLCSAPLTPGDCPPEYGGRGERVSLGHLRLFLIALFISVFATGCGGSPTVAMQPKPAQKSPTKSKPKASKKLAPEPTETSKPPRTETAAPKATRTPKDVRNIVRPGDSRPARNDAELARRGFTKLTSEHFILYSDMPKADITDLPGAIEQLYRVMENYFGPLPPDPQRKPYQMTGYLMADVERFRAAKIFTEGPAQPHEGWYLGNEFWWNRQATPYYTRHLMLHEATHCFMHVMPAMDCPPWYVEGMAELFGTHYQTEQGEYRFGAFPNTPDQLPGWARVSVLQEEIAAGRLPDVEQILAYKFDDFTKLPPYAWSWAFCHFLNNHPRYKVPFQNIARQMMDGGFLEYSTEQFRPHLADLRDEWLLFASQIQYGHDIERGVIDFQPGIQLSKSGESKETAVLAASGWQSSGIKVQAGRSYRLTASGQFILATTTKPWISEAQGISIRYFAGQPLGRLLGTVRPEPSGKKSNRDILKIIPLGPDATFVAPHSGTLYLRLNDAWNQLADNTGEVSVEIESIGS